jgi:hypothetical protein
VIGALFVSWDAGTTDIIIGLILGNLFVVLSWTFVAAPIAVKIRLTLYWDLRKVVGQYVMVIYNIHNAVLYCILAGAMITVSASAIRLPFNVPPQTHWYPEDWRFVVIVIFVGIVVVTLAILRFKRLSQISTLCSPWMFLMFVAGGLACLPVLAAQVPEIGSINSLDDFRYLAKNTIWTAEAVGGGSNNQLLCQLTANATSKTIIAGPDEATAVGNIMMQALVDGTFSSIEEGKKVISSSFDLKYFSQKVEDMWNEKYATFIKIKETMDTII